jgi:uncharacterized protein YPO0396
MSASGVCHTTHHRSDLDADEGAQLRYRKLHAINAEEPVSYIEAEQQECWRQVMKEEMKSILDNKTWTLEDLPRGHKAIGLKWVYKLKRNEEGEVGKHKVHLVAKGYVQRQGIDFEEVFALIARLESVRLLLAIASHFS